MYFVTEAVAARVVSMTDAIEVIESMFREYGRGEAEVFQVSRHMFLCAAKSCGTGPWSRHPIVAYR